MDIIDHIRNETKQEPEVIQLSPNGERHRHVVIEWAGGDIWLDMSEQSDHFCVDVRQTNPDGEMKGQGAFTIVNGRRAKFDTPLEDTTGRVVEGHGWQGGYVITLMTDLHGQEKAAIVPSQGNG